MGGTPPGASALTPQLTAMSLSPSSIVDALKEVTGSVSKQCVGTFEREPRGYNNDIEPTPADCH